jgi:hypothetical protein
MLGVARDLGDQMAKSSMLGVVRVAENSRDAPEWFDSKIERPLYGRLGQFDCSEFRLRIVSDHRITTQNSRRTFNEVHNDRMSSLSNSEMTTLIERLNPGEVEFELQILVILLKICVGIVPIP